MFQGRQYCFVEGTGTLRSDRPGFEFELCQSLTLRPSASSFMSQAHFPHPSNEGVYSVTKLCLTLWDPMDCSIPGLHVLHYLPEFAEIHVHWVCDAVKPSHLCHPFLLLPSVFPSIRVFFNELVLCIRWPKYWSFHFSISPSNEYSGLISLRIDWFNLAVQGTLTRLLPLLSYHNPICVLHKSHYKWG